MAGVGCGVEQAGCETSPLSMVCGSGLPICRRCAGALPLYLTTNILSPLLLSHSMYSFVCRCVCYAFLLGRWVVWRDVGSLRWRMGVNSWCIYSVRDGGVWTRYGDYHRLAFRTVGAAAFVAASNATYQISLCVIVVADHLIPHPSLVGWRCAFYTHTRTHLHTHTHTPAPTRTHTRFLCNNSSRRAIFYLLLYKDWDLHLCICAPYVWHMA